MATLRKKRKIAAVSRGTPEKTRIIQSQNTLDPEMAQEYLSRFSEEVEGRVTKKFSKEFSRADSRIFGSLSKLYDFVRNPQVRTCSVAVPVTSRNSASGNWEPNGDHSPNDSCPEAVVFFHHSGNPNSSEMEEYLHMVTGVQEEVPYCSTGTPSGKQKKAPSTSQPQFHSENTPASMEADKILLAFQQLTTNNNSSNFN